MFLLLSFVLHICVPLFELGTVDSCCSPLKLHCDALRVQQPSIDAE